MTRCKRKRLVYTKKKIKGGIISGVLAQNLNKGFTNMKQELSNIISPGVKTSVAEMTQGVKTRVAEMSQGVNKGVASVAEMTQGVNQRLTEMSQGVNKGLASVTEGAKVIGNDLKKASVKSKLSGLGIDLRKIEDFDSYFGDKSKSVDQIVKKIRADYDGILGIQLEHDLDNSDKRDTNKTAFKTVADMFPGADHRVIADMLKTNNNDVSKVTDLLRPKQVQNPDSLSSLYNNNNNNNNSIFWSGDNDDDEEMSQIGNNSHRSYGRRNIRSMSDDDSEFNNHNSYSNNNSKLLSWDDDDDDEMSQIGNNSRRSYSNGFGRRNIRPMSYEIDSFSDDDSEFNNRKSYSNNNNNNNNNNSRRSYSASSYQAHRIPSSAPDYPPSYPAPHIPSSAPDYPPSYPAPHIPSSAPDYPLDYPGPHIPSSTPSYPQPPLEKFIDMFSNLDKTVVEEVYNRNNKNTERPDIVENNIIMELFSLPPPDTEEANFKILYEILPDIPKDVVRKTYNRYNNVAETVDALINQQQKQQKQPTPAGIFAEPQEGLLCAKHAINNLLQEKKFVNDTGIPNSETNPLDTKIQLSFNEYCDTLRNTDDPNINHQICLQRGDLKGEMEIEGVQLLLKNVLGYRIHYGVLVDEEAIINLQKQKCLGAVLRTQQAGGHYVAISKINQQYVLIDSLGPRAEPFGETPNLITNLRNRLHEAVYVIYVYHQPGAYESVTSNHGWNSSGYIQQIFTDWPDLDNATIDIMDQDNDRFETLRNYILTKHPSEQLNNPPINVFLSYRNIDTVPKLNDALNDVYEEMFILENHPSSLLPPAPQSLASSSPRQLASSSPRQLASSSPRQLASSSPKTPDQLLQEYIQNNKAEKFFGNNANVQQILSKMKEVEKCMYIGENKSFHDDTLLLINYLEKIAQVTDVSYLFTLLGKWIENCKIDLNTHEDNFFSLCNALCKGELSPTNLPLEQVLQKYIKTENLEEYYGKNSSVQKILSRMENVEKCINNSIAAQNRLSSTKNADKNRLSDAKKLLSSTKNIIRILKSTKPIKIEALFISLNAWISECQKYLHTNENNFFNLCTALCYINPSSLPSASSSPSSLTLPSSSSPNLSAPLTPVFVQTVAKKMKNKFDDILIKAAQPSSTVGEFVNNIFANKSISNDKMKIIFFTILALIFSKVIQKKFSGGGSTDVQTIENLLKQLGVSENTINEFEEKVEENKNVDVIKLVEDIKGGRPTRKRLFRQKTRHTVNRL
jgi:hypothetical protein